MIAIKPLLRNVTSGGSAPLCLTQRFEVLLVVQDGAAAAEGHAGLQGASASRRESERRAARDESDWAKNS